MCGLVAIINEGLLQTKVRDFIEESLIVNSLRGTDSSGAFSVNNKGECIYYKKALPGWDFVQLNGAVEVLSLQNIRFMVGHNRSSTRGIPTKLEHAHPILYENIILAHNGTLVTTYDLNRGIPQKETSLHDSTAIAMSIYRRGPLETLEILEGAYALIWYNTVDCTLNFARNAERPLYMCQLEKDNGWAVASEGGMLKWLADRNSIDIKQVSLLKEGILMTIPLNSKENISRRKFKIYESRRTSYATGYSNNYSQQWWTYGYTPTQKGEVFKAEFQGKHQDPKSGKSVLRFKRSSDSAWGWQIFDHPQKPFILETNKIYTLEAVEERIVGDTKDKLAMLTDKEVSVGLPFTGTQKNGGSQSSESKTIPPESQTNLFQHGDEVEFLILEIYPIRKSGGARINLKGNTLDDSSVEIRMYNIDTNKRNIGIDNLYKAKVATRVYKTSGRTGEIEDYLVLDRDTIKEIVLSGETCSWCDGSLENIGGQPVPELSNTAILCSGCLKIYNGYDSRE